MKVKDSNYADYKTARQWAKKGYLPVDGAAGVELWANAYCNGNTIQYLKRQNQTMNKIKKRWESPGVFFISKIPV